MKETEAFSDRAFDAPESLCETIWSGGHRKMDVDAAILKHVRDHHVLSLCANGVEGLWAASCFYAFDPDAMALVVMTSRDTRHGRLMLDESRVAGTIAGQPRRLTDVRGIQFVAVAEMLEGEPKRMLLNLYCRRHPVARLLPSDVWKLLLMEVKYTDNKLIFGRKLYWNRS